MRIPYHSSHVRIKMSKEFNLIVCFFHTETFTSLDLKGFFKKTHKKKEKTTMNYKNISVFLAHLNGMIR